MAIEQKKNEPFGGGLGVGTNDGLSPKPTGKDTPFIGGFNSDVANIASMVGGPRVETQENATIEPLNVQSPPDTVLGGETTLAKQQVPTLQPTPDRVIEAPPTGPPPTLNVQQPLDKGVQESKVFDEQGNVITSTQKETLGPDTTKQAFTLHDPLTGTTQEFEDLSKFNKAKIDQAKSVEEKKQSDEIAGITGDIFTDALTNIQKSLDPTTPDPIAEAAFNWQLGKLSPAFSAQNAGLTLKLKQAGIDPNAPGAGLAMINQMARQQNASLSDVVGKLNVQSQHRMAELSKWGVDKAMDIQEFQLRKEKDKWQFGVEKLGFLANTLKSDNPEDYATLLSDFGFSGVDTEQFMKDITSNNELDKQAALRSLSADYGQTQKMVSGYAPGVAVDGASWGGLDPSQLSDVMERLSEIQSDVSKGKPSDIETAREKLLELQSLYPDVFAGDLSKWDPNDLSTLGDFARKEEILAGSLSLVSRGDDDGAVDLAVSSGLIDPVTAPEKFDALWDTQNDRDKRITMELAGLTEDPITLEEKTRYLAAAQVKGLKDTTDTVGQAVDQYLENASPEFKTWYQEPGNADDFNTFITNMMQGNVMTINDQGQFEVDNRQVLDPTNPDSIIAHKFLDWPYAVDANGEFIDPSEWGSNENVYQGNNPVTDGDFSESSGGQGYQEKMDKAWESYVARGGSRTRSEWFVDSKGGTDFDVPVGSKEEEKITSGDIREDVEQTAIDKVNALIGSEDTPGTGDASSFTTADLLEIEENRDLMNKMVDATTADGTPIFFEISKNFGFDDVFNVKQFNQTGLKADRIIHQSDKNPSGVESDSSAGSGNGSVVMHEGKFYRIVEFVSRFFDPLTGKDDRQGQFVLEPIDPEGQGFTINTNQINSSESRSQTPERVSASNILEPQEGEEGFVGPPSPEE